LARFQIKQIYRYPVKSMQGEALTEALVTDNGIRFDRGWALRDEATGNISGAKRFPALLYCSARYLEDTNAGSVPHAEITMPDGRRVNTDDVRVHAELSEVVGRNVSLWPLQPASNAEHYRTKRPDNADLEQELHAMFALEPDEPLPDFANFAPAVLQELMEYASPRGTYFDAFPINILTEASLRRFQDFLPDATINAQRFRPNILLADDAGEVGLAENAWVGRTAQIGEVRLSVQTECPRCVVTTCDQPGLEKDPRIMRTLVRRTNQNLSIYADVARGGTVRLGDELNLL